MVTYLIVHIYVFPLRLLPEKSLDIDRNFVTSCLLTDLDFDCYVRPLYRVPEPKNSLGPKPLTNLTCIFTKSLDVYRLKSNCR